MKPPPPRRAFVSAGLGGQARVGPGKFLRSATQKVRTPALRLRKKFQGALAGTTAGATIGRPAGVSERKRLAGDLGGERERGVWR